MIAGEVTRQLIRHGIKLRRTLGGWSGQIHGHKFRARKNGALWQISEFDRAFMGRTLGESVESFIRYIESEINDEKTP